MHKVIATIFEALALRRPRDTGEPSAVQVGALQLAELLVCGAPHSLANSLLASDQRKHGLLVQLVALFAKALDLRSYGLGRFTSLHFNSVQWFNDSTPFNTSQ